MQTAPPPAPPHANATPAVANPYLTPNSGPPAVAHWGGHPPYRNAARWVPPPPPRPAPRPAPLRPRELAAVGAVALACDAALWSHDGLSSGGFGMGLLFVALPLTLAVAARSPRVSPRLAVIAGLLAAVVARCVFDPTFGTVLSGLALLGAFAFALRARRTFVPEALLSALAGLSKVGSRVGATVAGVRKLTARTRVGNVSLAPILVPLALVGVFAGIFALANPVVAHAFDVGFTALARVVGIPSPTRVFMWVASVVFAAALLRPALHLARGTEAAAVSGEATPTSLLVARNALGALNVLFLLYNALDAAYLWTGAPPAGLRTQQYAHQGAFWLTVALVMCTGVIGVMFRGPLAHDARARLSRTLAYAWMAQGLVLALGTYRRIAIHIANSGLSDLRIVGILGTSLVVAGVIAVALKLRRRRTFTWLVRRQLDAFAVTLILYSVFPTHLVSARVNVARIEGGEYRPVLHMFRQSSRPESAAELVPLLHHHDVRVRQGVAALLEHEREALVKEAASQTSWRARDLVTRRTLRALEAARPETDAALGAVDHAAARQVLLELSRVANDGRSLEELLAVPDAAAWVRDGTARRGDAY